MARDNQFNTYYLLQNLRTAIVATNNAIDSVKKGEETDSLNAIVRAILHLETARQSF